MGFLDAIFGSGPEVITPEPQVQTAPTQTKEQQELLKSLIGNLQPKIGQPTPAFQPSGGALAPGISNLEQMSLASLEQQAMNLASGEGPVAAASTALQGILTGGPQDIDEFFTSNVAQPLQTEFLEDILPDISRRTARNFFGGERRSIEQNAIEDLVDQLSRERSRLAFETRESDLNRKLQAAGIAGDVALNPLIQLLGAGSVPRGIEGDLIDAERAEFERQTGQQNTVVNQILAALGLETQENIVSTPVVVPGQEGILGDLISGGAKIGAVAMGAPPV